jgi:hypothetical protein
MSSMSPEVRAEYNRALARAAAKNGSFVAPNASFYGWMDWNAYEHMKTCQVVVPDTAKAEEDTWDEFQGTFYEGDTTHTGVVVKGVSCRCGRYTNRDVRWAATVQEVAEAVFIEAFGAQSRPSTEQPEKAAAHPAPARWSSTVPEGSQGGQWHVSDGEWTGRTTGR